VIYRFHPEAEAEHLGQIAFYEGRQKGLGALYRKRFLKVISWVCASSARYRIVRRPDIRRARLQEYPLSIIYRERGGEIQVLAVAHDRRRPGYWTRRAR
jgi:hypothetical protein